MTLAVAVTERDLDHHVRQLLQQHRLYGYHTRDSRGSDRGFPDWVIIGPRGLLWRELKASNGRLTSEQRAIGYALGALSLDWDVWRPADLFSGRVEREIRSIR